MREVPLGKTGPNKGSKVALVDDEDWDKVKDFNYHEFPDDNNVYARRHIYKDGIKIGASYMHFDIMGIKGLDHADKYGLNNTRENLRKGSASQNAMNVRKGKGRTSKHKGVSRLWTKRKRSGQIIVDKRWRSGIKLEGCQMNLGSFPFTSDGEDEAGWRYDLAALYFFGDWASFNFPERMKLYLEKYKVL